MTELELQELTDKIIAKLKADSLTIDQLTQTNVLTGMDFLELNSGRKVSLDDLRKFIRGYGIYLEIISKLDNETIPPTTMYSHLFVSCLKSLKRLKNLKNNTYVRIRMMKQKYLLKLLGGAKIGKSLTVGDFITGRSGRLHR